MESHPRQRTRILIVDDHPVSRAGLAVLMSPVPDLEVVGQASSGSEAVELFRRLHPDVVFMDLRMPGMGGLEEWLAEPDPKTNRAPRIQYRQHA